MVHGFDPFQSCLFEAGVKKLSPVVRRYQHLTILCTNKLSMVDNCRAFNHLHDVFKASDLCPAISLLEEAEAPIRRKFGVPDYQERQRYRLIQANQDSPCKVLHDEPVFILAATVICVEVQPSLPKIVRLKKVMQHAYDVICPFACIHSFINEIVHLYVSDVYNHAVVFTVKVYLSYLSWNSLTTNPKNGTFAGCHEKHRPDLLRMTRIVHLHAVYLM